MRLKVADLFSGIGGFSLGLERTGGFETVAFCEINTKAVQLLGKHWPDITVHEDIKTIGELPSVDVVTGGFPCTDLSNSSKSTKLGLDGEHSGLFFDLARVVNKIKPKYFIFENVIGVKKFMDRIKLEFPDYSVDYDVFEAAEFGANCRRKRVYIIGSLRAGGAREILDLAKEHRTIDESRGPKDVLPMLLPWKGGVSLERLASCVVEGSEIDATRIREGDGFPRRVDGYRYLMLGNAVVPNVVEAIGRGVIEYHPKETDNDISE